MQLCLIKLQLFKKLQDKLSHILNSAMVHSVYKIGQNRHQEWCLVKPDRLIKDAFRKHSEKIHLQVSC